MMKNVWLLCSVVFLIFNGSVVQNENDMNKALHNDATQLQEIAKEEIQIDQLESEFIYVYQLEEQQSIYEKNAQEKMYPASMTKIMTALVALENIKNKDEKITITEKMLAGLEEENASVAGFEAGDLVSVDDLLHGILMVSGADACRAIAYYVAGSEEAFVSLMNDKAEEIGLVNTHFVNTTGLHDPDHYTTAEEMGKILLYAIKNEFFLDILLTKTYKTSSLASNDSGITMKSTLWKGIEALGADDSLIQGGKTGFTFAAGHCLASISMPLQGATYLCIVGNAPGSYGDVSSISDTLKIYRYLREHYTYQLVYEKGDPIISSTKEGLLLTTTIDFYAAEDIFLWTSIADGSVECSEIEEEENAQKDGTGKILCSAAHGESKIIDAISVRERHLNRSGWTIIIMLSTIIIGFAAYIYYLSNKNQENGMRFHGSMQK